MRVLFTSTLALLTFFATSSKAGPPPQPLGKYSIRTNQGYVWPNRTTTYRATPNFQGGYNYRYNGGFTRSRQNVFNGEGVLSPRSGNMYVRPLRIR